MNLREPNLLLHSSYYDLCKHANSIGFVSGPRSEVFHLAERFLQGLSSNRYVMDDETFPLPKNTLQFKKMHC